MGLDIWPDALRHPFGFESPLVGLDDYHHALVQTPRSRTVNRLFHELGADVTEYVHVERGGAESQFSRAPAGIAFATGNVTFFPRTDVLVADAGVRERLRSDQWELLVDAAADTRAWAAGRQPSDFEAAADFCDRGGEIVAASDSQLAELQEAASGVTRWLREDPTTRRLVDEIARVVDDAPAESPVTECPGHDDPSTALDGVYRARVRQGTLARAGANPTQIQENSGRWTWTLEKGTFTFHTESSHYLNKPDGSGRYTYDGTFLVIYWDEVLDDVSTVRVTTRGEWRPALQRRARETAREPGSGPGSLLSPLEARRGSARLTSGESPRAGAVSSRSAGRSGSLASLRMKTTPKRSARRDGSPGCHRLRGDCLRGFVELARHDGRRRRLRPACSGHDRPWFSRSAPTTTTTGRVRSRSRTSPTRSPRVSDGADQHRTGLARGRATSPTGTRR